MKDKVKFIFDSVELPDIKNKIYDIDDVCAMTGDKIISGYRFKDVVKSATSGVSDYFRYKSEYVSVEAAGCFRASSLLRGNFICLEDRWLQPMVSKESAQKQNRVCWRDLIFEIEMGQKCLCVFTNEFKKRLWYEAEVSRVGENWKPFFNGNVVKVGKTYKSKLISRTLNINIFELRDCLILIEEIQKLGFSKRGVLDGILNETKTLDEVGVLTCLQYEKSLKQIRNMDNFNLALFIAQGGYNE